MSRKDVTEKSALFSLTMLVKFLMYCKYLFFCMRFLYVVIWIVSFWEIFQTVKSFWRHNEKCWSNLITITWVDCGLFFCVNVMENHIFDVWKTTWKSKIDDILIAMWSKIDFFFLSDTHLICRQTKIIKRESSKTLLW